MKGRAASLMLIASAMVTGCQDTPVTPNPASRIPERQLYEGGIPGPPPGLVIPNPPGPPPNVPGKRPPHAGPPSFLTNIVDIGAGSDFSCALRSDSVVLCWGANGQGQLGDGSQAPSSVPVEVSGPIRFARIFVGDVHVCGLTAAGAAYCWGSNFRGRLGAGIAQPLSSVPVAVAGGLAFRELAVGLSSTCGIATDGVTYCWGDNNNRQLGTGSTAPVIDVPTPVLNTGSLAFASISSGFLGSCGLTSSGAAHCWGREAAMFGNGGSGPPPTQAPTLAANGASFASIAVGNIYACGISNAGGATCWGSAASGELGIGPNAGA